MFFSRRSFVHKLGLGTLASISLADSRSGFAFDFGPDAGIANHPLLLDQNENPYGPFESVGGAIKDSLRRLNRYPDAAADRLTQTLSQFHNVPSERLVLGCGSTDILRAAASAFLARGSKLLIAAPSFPPMVDYAKQSESLTISIPLNKYFEHDLEAMLSKIDSATRLVYICSPSSATGTITPRRHIENFIDKVPKHVHVIMDEAYHEFVEPSSTYASFIEHPVANPRVIVTRTFSKIFGLAGLRVGYAIASRDVAIRLRDRVTQHGVNAVAIEAASAAMADHNALRSAIQRNTDDRQEFLNEATGRRLKPLPGHTNFSTFDTTVPGSTVVEHFKKNNILIYGPLAMLDRYVRVSIGTPSEMLEFWRVWDLLGIHPQGHH